MKAKLGDKVKDKVSGFTGIVTAQHNYLEGCTRLTVQPKINKDGTLPASETFDEPTLKVIKKDKFSVGNTDIGGPSKFEDTSR